MRWPYSISTLDIPNENDYKLRQSKVRVPREAFAGALARIHGIPELKQSFTLTLGWTRRLKKLKKFTNIRIPMEIERMISQWYSIEWIHWIMSDIPKQKRSNLRNHQKIPLHDILNENISCNDVHPRSLDCIKSYKFLFSPSPIEFLSES